MGGCSHSGGMKAVPKPMASISIFVYLYICIFKQRKEWKAFPHPPFSVAVILSMDRGRMRLKVQEKERTQNNILSIH